MSNSNFNYENDGIVFFGVHALLLRWSYQSYFSYMETPRPNHGFMYLLCDGAFVEYKDGSVDVFKKGDVLYIPKGLYYNVKFSGDMEPLEALLINFSAAGYVPKCEKIKKVIENASPAYLDSFPQPEDFPKEYYLFCINTFNGEISISIISGTHKNGIITQDEALYFNGSYGNREYPRFKVKSEDKETLEDLTISSKELQEMKYGSYYFGNCIWDGAESEYDLGWYRSLERREENNWIHAKKGGPVEVRALVSKTVFDKLKALQGELYDMPAKDFLDQLDKIFEEELTRSRTKQEIEG